MPRVPGPKDEHSNIPEDTIQARDVPLETTAEVANLIPDAGWWSCEWEVNEYREDIDARAKTHRQFLEALHKVYLLYQLYLPEVVAFEP